MTSHVYTRFFTYDATTSAWEKLPSELRDLPLTGLAWVPDTSALYSLGTPSRSTEVANLVRFSRNGALIGRVPLDPAIPVGPGDVEHAQLHESSGKLVLLLPPLTESDAASPPTGRDRIFLIDPTTGAVSAHRTGDTVASSD